MPRLSAGAQSSELLPALDACTTVLEELRGKFASHSIPAPE